MVHPLVPCPACARHVRTTHAACPFCAMPLPADLARRAVPDAPTRLGRAALFAFGASIAVGACGSDVASDTAGSTSGSGGSRTTTTGATSTTTNGGMGGALYGGAPPPLQDAGPEDGGDAGTAGAGGAGGDPGGGMGGCPSCPMSGPAYGSPPPPPHGG